MNILIEELLYMQESLDNIMIDELLESNLPAVSNNTNAKENEKSKLESLKKWLKDFSKRVLDNIIKVLNNISEFIKDNVKRIMSIVKGQNGVKKEVKKIEFNHRFFERFMQQANLFVGIVENLDNDSEIVQKGIDNSKKFLVECKKEVTKERVMIETNSTTKVIEQVTRLTKVLNDVDKMCKRCKNVALYFKRKADAFRTDGIFNSQIMKGIIHKYNSASQVMAGYAGIIKQISGYVASSIKQTLSKDSKQDVVYA